jgi:hypothetical protein
MDANVSQNAGAEALKTSVPGIQKGLWAVVNGRHRARYPRNFNADYDDSQI